MQKLARGAINGPQSDKLLLDWPVVRVLWFMPLTFLAGIDGFGWFMPYLLVVVAVAAVRRGISLHRVPARIATSGSILSELESASA